jgi:hypothetical protein
MTTGTGSVAISKIAVSAGGLVTNPTIDTTTLPPPTTGPRSLLFSESSPLVQPPQCGPCRQEVTIKIRKDGREYIMKLRDKIVVDDPYLVMVKAVAFAIREGEPYSGRAPSRGVRDFLIKSAVVI